MLRRGKNVVLLVSVCAGLGTLVSFANSQQSLSAKGFSVAVTTPKLRGIHAAAIVAPLAVDTATVTETATETTTNTAVATFTASTTATTVNSATFTVTNTTTPTATATVTSSTTGSPQMTATQTGTRSPILSPSSTVTNSNTSTATFTATPTRTFTAAPPSSTPASTNTAIYSATPTSSYRSSTMAASISEVLITSSGFSPQSLTITVGDTVTWKNNDTTTHSPTSDTGIWTAETLNNGGLFSHTFVTAGDFAYHCGVVSSLTGTIHVLAVSNTATPVPTTVPAATSTPVVTVVPPTGMFFPKALFFLLGILCVSGGIGLIVWERTHQTNR